MHRRLPGLAAVLAILLGACGSPSSTPAPSRTPSATAAPSSAAPEPSEEPTAEPTPQPSAAQPAWRQLSADVAEVGGREDHTWTVTPDGAVAYLFGGRRSDGTALADLWAYDLAGGTWESIAARGPSARFGHDAAWVDGVGLVVFGGQAGPNFFNDLWAFDPAADAWRRLPAGGAVPVARYGSCGALGPDGRFWISHGFTADLRRFADTRAYDFTIGAWTDETPVAAQPLARCLHACWWTDAGELALYAGQTTGITSLGDWWTLTPGPRQGTATWTERTPATAPPDRNLYAAARVAGATLVFGGQALDGGYLNDAWLLGDDGSVTPLAATGGPPAPRSGAELVAVPDGGRLLLFGGRDGDGAMADLWELAF